MISDEDALKVLESMSWDDSRNDNTELLEGAPSGAQSHDVSVQEVPPEEGLRVITACGDMNKSVDGCETVLNGDIGMNDGGVLSQSGDAIISFSVPLLDRWETDIQKACTDSTT